MLATGRCIAVVFLGLLSLLVAGCAAGGMASTAPPPGPTPAPTPAPTPSPTAHSVSISWSASSSPGVVSYNVYRATAPSAGPTKIGNATGTNFIDTSVQAGQTYFYTVTAVNSANLESPEPSEVSVTVPSS